MKRIIFTAFIVLSALVLNAQKDNDFYKHEVKLSVGDASLYNINLDTGEKFYNNISIAYLFRPEKWAWVGVNFVNYFGNKIYYNWREYDTNGNFSDFSKSKMKYGFVIAPEIRLSYLNKERAILYSSFSAGVGWENGYDYYDRGWNREVKYPKKVPYLQITYLGFSINFGRNDNIFLGGELGLGFKGFFNFHGGYRF